MFQKKKKERDQAQQELFQLKQNEEKNHSIETSTTPEDCVSRKKCQLKKNFRTKLTARPNHTRGKYTKSRYKSSQLCEIAQEQSALLPVDLNNFFF